MNCPICGQGATTVVETQQNGAACDAAALSALQRLLQHL